ncbi:hypothetical protein TorRG33x02_315040 [Trema orientale]|uniref:Uncharacterized protein n=1 Tax=Trema orientale TaxID=63057 RepID=A0A2P5BNC8_TREOI|nr:hypothetical protein TorRG33x02_315040 [Trema orientale]
MNVPLKFSARIGNFEQELNSTRTVIGINKNNLAAINHYRFTKRQCENENRRYLENFDEKPGGGLGAEDNALRPTEGEAGVVIGVEVGEEVGDGVVAGVAEGVDEKTSAGNVFGLRESGGKRRERERRWGGVVVEGLLGGEKEVGGGEG